MKRIPLYLLAILSLVACSKEGNGEVNPAPEKPKSEITITTTGTDFSTDGGVNEISFTTSEAWSASVVNTRADGWLSINPTSGAAGNAKINVTTKPNDTPDDRSASIIIKAGTTSKTINVSQKQKDALTVTASKFEVGAEGGEVKIEVKANINFEYAIEESAKDWVTQANTRALKTSTLTFKVAANEETQKREAKITIKSGEFNETVTIYQAGSTPSIVISKNEYVVSADGEVINVEVTSNVDVKVEMPTGVDWISENKTRATSTNTYSFDVAPSQEYEQRSAEIRFTNKENGLSEVVKVVQVQKDAIVIAKNSYTVNNKGDQIEIEVGHNVDFNVEISSDWITQANTRAFTTDKLLFNIAENKTNDNREASITFTSTDGAISQVVKVYQAQEDALIISKKEIVVSEESGTLSFEIQTNVEFKVSEPNVGWLRAVTTRGLTTHTLSYEYDANTEYDSREALIVVTDVKNNKAETITITQAQKDAIVLAKEEYNVDSKGTQLEIEVGHNVDFNVEISSDWITQTNTRAFTTDKLLFNIAENKTNDNREASITFTSTDGAISQVVKVYQAQEDALIISKKEIVVSEESGTLSFEIQANVEFKVSEPNVGWLRAVTTRGLTTHTLSYEYDANTEYDSREALIVVTDVKNNKAETITITQAQKDAIVLAKSEYELGAEGGNLDFEIQTNVEVTVTISDNAKDWIQQVETRALVTKALYFNVSAYPDGEEREGTITITGGNAKQTITVIQGGLKEVLAKERAALIELYNAAGGDNWTNNTNWCSDKPVGEWYGVGVNEKGLVTTLDLMNNGIVCNDFPESITDLGYLDCIYLTTTSTEFPQNILKLKQLIYLEWQLNEYKGELPKEISNLQNLTHLGISGDFTSLPEELGNMKNLEYIGIDGPWSGGSQTITSGIPMNISKLGNLKHLHIGWLDMPIEIPDWIYEMKSLEELQFRKLGLTGTISEKISNLTNLKSLWLSENKLEGNIPNGITSLANLESLLLESNNLTGNIPIGFAQLTKLIEIWAYGNRLSGELPYDFEQNPNYNLWGVDQNVMIQQPGYGLTYPSDAYESTDFSKDGEVIVLQEATKGNGVNIVLLGDGFVDTDMSDGGAYEEAMNEAFGYLFALEPMKSYKEYFNVYAVKAVSKHNRFAEGYSTALGSYLGIAPYVSGDIDKCLEYASKAPITSTKDLTVAVMLNSNVYAGTTFWLENDLGVAFIGMARPADGFYEKRFESTFIHEVVGHGFGKLADEYVYYNETYPDAGNMELRQEWIESGYYANVDIISDPAQIRWAHMLNDEQFSSYTGIVEGGDLFAYGIWRPEEISMMNNNQPYFNAPSREAIVKRIMKLAGEEYSFESFAEKDKYNPLPNTRANVTKEFEPTPSPVMIKGDWRKAMNNVPKR
ncbi:MAG: hypothetical protein E7099_05250 [Mediterranea massiliensis]|nr:hypothetical protein [Mediterranea massiliensis]